MASLALDVDPAAVGGADGVRINDQTLRKAEALGRRQRGFQFDNCFRNNALARGGVAPPKVLKTGTTIVGCCYNGGLVLGADTRATAGTVADKNCEKIHYIAPNIYCCGAGTAADTEMTTQLISSQLELMRLNSGSPSRVAQAMTRLKRYLFGYQGYVSAALVLGGVDVTGPHLYTIYPHGSTDKLPFVTMGSGSLAAMSVFEKGYKDGLTEEEAVQLVRGAIEAGIFNDLGSGSNVDICVIRNAAGNMPFDPKSVDYRRGAYTPNDQSELRKKVKRNPGFDYKKGTSKVKSERVIATGATAAAPGGDPNSGVKLAGLGFLDAALEEARKEKEEKEGDAMDED